MTVRHKLPGNVKPQGTRCVPVFIPDDPDYLSAFLTAIEYTLLLDRHWKRDENKTAVDVRREWYNRTYLPLKDALLNDVTCEDKNECEYPFWDEHTRSPDVDEDCEDDDGEAQSQFWNVADWIITGFLAVTTTPGAAITYQTLAPKVRILLERRSAGAIADFLINGVLVSSVDTSGTTGELIENVIDITELINAGTVPETATPGNVIELVKQTASAASVRPLSFGEFVAQQTGVQTELAVVTGNITYDENTGESGMTPQDIADGIKLYQQTICDCISDTGDGGEGGDGGETSQSAAAQSITGTATTTEKSYGESVALIRRFEDALFDIDAQYNSIDTGSTDPATIATEQDELEAYIHNVYEVLGVPGSPEVQDFILDVWDKNGVVGGFANGVQVWAGGVYCRDVSLRGTLYKLAYDNLTGNNLDNFLLALAMFKDEQFVTWAQNAPESTEYTTAPCYRYPDMNFSITGAIGSQLSESPIEWGESLNDRVIRVTATGSITNPAGDILTALYSYDSNADQWTYDPLRIGKQGNTFQDFSWSTQPRGTGVWTAEAPNSPNNDIQNGEIRVRDSRSFASTGDRLNATGSIEITIEDLGTI
jgi:hypothetical protein